MSLNFLGIVGSLHCKFTNRGLLCTASTRLFVGAEMDLVDLTDVPFYNADITDEPASVVRVFEQIGRVDTLVLACPEYNYSLVPALRNTLDWASCESNNALPAGKPVAISDAGDGMGTSRVWYHLRQVCVYLDLHPLSKPGVFANAFAGGFTADGDLTDERIAGLTTEQMQVLASWTSKHKVRKKPCLR